MEIEWGEVWKVATALVSIFSLGIAGGAFGGTAVYRLFSESDDKSTQTPTWDERRTETSYRLSIARSMFGDSQSFSQELKSWIMQPLGVYKYKEDAQEVSWDKWLEDQGFLNE